MFSGALPRLAIVEAALDLTSWNGVSAVISVANHLSASSAPVSTRRSSQPRVRPVLGATCPDEEWMEREPVAMISFGCGKAIWWGREAFLEEASQSMETLTRVIRRLAGLGLSRWPDLTGADLLVSAEAATWKKRTITFTVIGKVAVPHHHRLR